MDLMTREQRLYACLTTIDGGNQEQYKAELSRIGFIESARYLQYMIDTEQQPEFVAWERKKQATTLASYR